VGRSAHQAISQLGRGAEGVVGRLSGGRWPLRIENPLPSGSGQDRKTRLQNTVKNLNRGLRDGGIRFSMDGTGEAVRWSVDR
jgi:hypothetical protein